MAAATAILAGTATVDGYSGADYTIKNHGILPKNYLTKEEAEDLGWIRQLGNLRKVAPGATIGGDIFRNDKRKLPEAPGRVWFEADVNYTGGIRNSHRVLYSSDGLVFVTYDHFKTFCEIV